MSQVLRVLAAASALVAVVALFRAPLGDLLQQLGGLPVAQRSAPSGFMLRVESDPEGGVVAVDRTLRGDAPLLANVTCNDGEEVAIEVAWPPADRIWRRQVPCRPGKSLLVRARKGQ